MLLYRPQNSSTESNVMTLLRSSPHESLDPLPVADLCDGLSNHIVHVLYSGCLTLKSSLSSNTVLTEVSASASSLSCDDDDVVAAPFSLMAESRAAWDAAAGCCGIEEVAVAAILTVGNEVWEGFVGIFKRSD